METAPGSSDPDHPQDADAARSAIESARAEEAATVRRLTPAWFGPAVAALLLVAFTLQAFRPDEGGWRVASAVLILVACLAVAALVGAHYRESIYRQPKTTWNTGAILSVLVVAVIAAAPIFLEPAWGSWVWLCSGILVAGLVITFWGHYRRHGSHG
ncbi:MAG TPA: hypothetical protein H9871_11705 [Candidatus Nesterenkonia stercoripullorum]|uniref:Uncharacterized protein n=1 Tax=Candidatus Nesterenkonia stercoripullorum TaxID=2838701 RepID=A0A9D2A8S5_9MICC|nr:hypothetical protein [Candidatus Nesterenkonia stercoripullorum]